MEKTTKIFNESWATKLKRIYKRSFLDLGFRVNYSKLAKFMDLDRHTVSSYLNWYESEKPNAKISKRLIDVISKESLIMDYIVRIDKRSEKDSYNDKKEIKKLWEQIQKDVDQLNEKLDTVIEHEQEVWNWLDDTEKTKEMNSLVLVVITFIIVMLVGIIFYWLFNIAW